MSLLFLDLELGRDESFHGMAARRDGEERVWEQVRFDVAHRELIQWLRPGDVLAGHNLHRFDRPAIERRVPSSPLLQLPTVDTLELSVLSHPGRPYHRLVKDDRLVRDSRPNPLSDVRASEVVARDALEQLRCLAPGERELICALLPRIPSDPTARAGWQHLFRLLDWAWDEQLPLALAEAWRGRVCRNAPLLRDPPLDLGLVMLAAWLRVASRNDGSVLPPWVRRAWPASAARLRSLRATRCDDPACDWCTTNLSPEHWLREVFGFDGFRPEPAAPQGGSLQRVLVDAGLRGTSTFGILPTGGGKSLCFQVPAEARHRLLGQLTVVISPLQSLMKDQVDGLQDRIGHARAIYSGLPALLRPQVLEEVRTGECGLLYLSPEQFRNAGIVRLLAQRDVGAIVFDEAHCLSQWGHDFRTDYPYVLKAVRRLMDGQALPMPPVFLFTATTQHDATQEILRHVAEHTGSPPTLLDGGSRRDNLRYEVRQVPEAQRIDATVELLIEHLGDGAAIVFCGSRGRTESTAEALSSLGFPAAAYHAGLEADARRELQNAFMAGHHRVITATNAFGMGVDKDNVRLVVHLDMPSSLEAYLQEAGRAGRDRKPATAVLLWSPGDAEARFALGATGDLGVEDLEALWRAIRQLPAERVQSLERRVVTARELLFQEALTGRFDPQDSAEETRVKAGVNWLERAGVLERRENHTLVFSGRPREPSFDAAQKKLAALDLPPNRQRQWELVLKMLYEAGDAGISADGLAVLCKALSYADPLEGGLRVLSILDQMVEQRFISAGQTFTAFVSRGVADSSSRRFDRWADWEMKLMAHLDEAGVETQQVVHLQAIAERLTTPEVACTVPSVARLLGAWSSAGQGLTHAKGLVRFQQLRGSSGILRVDTTRANLDHWLRTRRDVARRALDFLLGCADGTGKQLLVSTELERVVADACSDLLRRPRMVEPGDAVRGAIAWLHQLHIITVQNGLAVFRSAMQLDRDPRWPTLRDGVNRDATEALQRHQSQKILRVHVMEGWAARMLDDPDRAELMRADWFRLPLEEFIPRWFPKSRQQIERPTTPESYHAIVTALADADQEKIVTRDPRRNHLVLAGPGSGKTRILVHRVAWLLRCQRVRPRQILIVCYTRANALELRRRLRALVGNDARHVIIRTLHGVAMAMVGGHRLGPGGDLTLETCIPVAAAMLRGEALEAQEQSRQRDALLRGVNHLFIDEYQDIDAEKYDLLSAIAGRAMDGDQRKLRVFAVGDDDQSIFTYDGASASFIRSFETDYSAQRFVIRHNYRNPRAVLELAQDLISPLPDRLKAGETLTVNPARAAEPVAGPWAAAHEELRGKIVWSRHVSVREAARQAVGLVRRWLDSGVEAHSIGILTRTRPHGLNRLRVAAEAAGVPFSWPLPSDTSIPIQQVREVSAIFELLGETTQAVPSQAISARLDQLGTGPWADALRAWLEPHDGRILRPEQWRYDLLGWARLERRARTFGEGVHLGTMHGAKGLEFDHVLVLDDETMGDGPEDRRLLYVAMTRARQSLQLYSSYEPSPVLRELRHPTLELRDAPVFVADAPAEHRYDVLGREDIWIDWLGRRDGDHEGHVALEAACVGDGFLLDVRGAKTAILDSAGREVGRLSQAGHERWAPRVGRGLRLRLLAALRERADDPWRGEEYRARLRVERWWTGVWEARWRE